MKKIYLILILFIFPLVVNAEAINQIDYEITTFNDETLIDEEGNELINVPASTTLTIDYEKFINNDVYGNTTYNGTTGFIKLKNHAIQNEKLSANSLTRHEEKKIKAIKDIQIYKGPSTMYEIVEDAKILKNTEISYYYSDDAWAYVDIDGTTGWIYIYQLEENNPYGYTAYISNIKEERELLTTTEVILYNNPSDLEETSIKVPANKELKTTESYTKHKGKEYVKVEYNDKSGWFEIQYEETSNLAAIKPKCYSVYVTGDYINMYNKYNDLSTKTQSKILQNTELEVLYIASIKDKRDWYYVKYKGAYGWIIGEEFENETIVPSIAIHKGTSYKYTTPSKLNIYEIPGSKMTDNTIPPSSSFIALYSIMFNEEKWLYVTYNDYKGWVKSSNTTLSQSIDQCLEIDDDYDQIKYEGVTQEQDNQNQQGPRPVAKKTNFGPIIFFVIVIIGLAVFLILYKKGKIKVKIPNISLKKKPKEDKNKLPSLNNQPQAANQAELNQQITQPQPAPVAPVQQAAPQQVIEQQVTNQPAAQPIVQPTIQPVPQVQQQPIQQTPVVQPTQPVAPVQTATPIQPVVQPIQPVQQPVQQEPTIIPFNGITNTVPIEDTNDNYIPTLNENQFVQTAPIEQPTEEQQENQ